MELPWALQWESKAQKFKTEKLATLLKLTGLLAALSEANVIPPVPAESFAAKLGLAQNYCCKFHLALKT